MVELPKQIITTANDKKRNYFKSIKLNGSKYVFQYIQKLRLTSFFTSYMFFMLIFFIFENTINTR